MRKLPYSKLLDPIFGGKKLLTLLPIKEAKSWLPLTNNSTEKFKKKEKFDTNKTQRHLFDDA